MEDNVTRVLIIAVSLFVTMLTISLVFMYYNTAKELATNVNTRTDIAETYDEIVTNIEKTSQYLTGVEIRQLIRKYAGDANVEINIYSISNMEIESALTGAEARDYYVEDMLEKGLYNNINNTWIDTKTGMIKEKYLSVIDPGWEKNWVTKEINGSKIELKLSLDDWAGVHH